MKRISLIGVPLDLGAGRRGVDMGPSAVRLTGLAARLALLGFRVEDRGDIDAPLPEECRPQERNQRYAREIGGVCRRLCDRVSAALADGAFPLTIGGDHSIAAGSVAGVARSLRAARTSLGLIWVDAHGDMNTPRSTISGNVHGMPLAALLGKGCRHLVRVGGFAPKVEPSHTALVGIRNLDDREKRLVKESGVSVYTMKDLDQRGMYAILEEAISIATRGTAGFHLSFDMDAVDPSIAPGVGTPVRGGLSYREAHLCMEVAAESGRMTSMDVVEINPVLDTRNATAELAAELVLSAMGKRIV